MARWRLTEPHYLAVPTERWEHTTTDSRTGKLVRKMYKVPRYLDPRVEDDWNVKLNGMDGEIHVCWEGKGIPNDIVFEGNPTPGMLPLDAEAEEISGKFSWTPTQGIDEDSQRQSFYARLGDSLIEQMAELKVARELAPVTPSLDKFMETMLAMMGQNQQILAALAGKSVALPDAGMEQKAHLYDEERIPSSQVIDEEEPLEDVEPTVDELNEAALIEEARQAISEKKAQNRMTSRRI